MYVAPIWSPIIKCDIQCLERVQRRFTNWLGNYYNTLYYERLISLNALTLEHEQIVFDVSLLHKCMYGRVDYCLEDNCIKLAANNERSGKSRLTQHHHASRVSNVLFQHRAVCEWNALPERLSKGLSFGQFK